MKMVSNYKFKKRLAEDVESIISIKYVEISNEVTEDAGVKLQVVASMRTFCQMAAKKNKTKKALTFPGRG